MTHKVTQINRDRAPRPLEPTNPANLFEQKILPSIATFYEASKDDILGVHAKIEGWLYDSIDEKPRDDRTLSVEYMAARKEFIIGMLASFQQEQALLTTEKERIEYRQRISMTEDILFSVSPNFADYIGGYRDIIGVIDEVEKVPEMRRAEWELTEGFMQGLAFSHDSESNVKYLTSLIATSDPVRKMRLLRIYDRLLSHSSDISYGDRAYSTLRQVLEDIADNEEESALCRVVSSGLLEAHKDESTYQAGTKTSLTERYGYTPLVELPERYRGYLVVKVAKGVVGLRNSYGSIDGLCEGELPESVSDVYFAYGRIAEVLARYPERDTIIESVEWLKNIGDFDASNTLRTLNPRDAVEFIKNKLSGKSVKINVPSGVGIFLAKNGMGEDMTELISEIHSPAIHEVLSGRLGIDIGELPLISQAYLLSYIAKTKLPEFNRTAEVINNYRGDKLSMLNSFLALEYGDDFGDVVLDVATKATPEQSNKLFDSLAGMRQRAVEYGQLFGDPELSVQVTSAMNERLTELMYVARELLEKGQVSCEVFGKIVKVEDLDELVDDYIAVLDSSLARIVTSMHDGKVSRVTEKNEQYDLFRFSDAKADNDMLLYIRPEAARSHNAQIEYGSSSGAEASISMIINPDGGHIGALKHERASQELSIRLDREGRRHGDVRTSTKDRDPTQHEGVVSLDIGSVLGQQDSFGTRLALIISTGNKLRSECLGNIVSLNHNTSPFDHERYGTASGFAAVAHAMSRMARVRITALKAGVQTKSQVASAK